MRFGIDTRKKRPDRAALEKIIFPELWRDPQWQRILFVGCAWYTLHYPSLFRDKDFHTMEIDPTQASYGARSHVIGSCESLSENFAPGFLDAIVLNGVFGFGLNTMEALARTLEGIHRTLRVGGVFVFGWNDLPANAPFPPFSICGWEHFEPYRFPTMDVAHYSSDSINRHHFHFFLNRP
jgi:SAM-dependent methyltransferase